MRVPGAPDAAWVSGAGRGAPKGAGMVREPCPRASLQWGQGALPTGQPRCGCGDGVRAGPRLGAGLTRGKPHPDFHQERRGPLTSEQWAGFGDGTLSSNQPHRDPPPGLTGVRRQAGGPPLAQPLGSASTAGPGDIHLSPSQLSRPLAEPHYKGFPERSEVSRATPLQRGTCTLVPVRRAGVCRPLPMVRTLTTHGVEGQMGVLSP